MTGDLVVIVDLAIVAGMIGGWGLLGWLIHSGSAKFGAGNCLSTTCRLQMALFDLSGVAGHSGKRVVAMGRISWPGRIREVPSPDSYMSMESLPFAKLN